jgi:hypothetical protein
MILRRQRMRGCMVWGWPGICVLHAKALLYNLQASHMGLRNSMPAWMHCRSTVSAYYLALMDSIHPICPDCLFLGEGTGATILATNWGVPACPGVVCPCFLPFSAPSHAVLRRSRKLVNDSEGMHACTPGFFLFLD